jgi:hypothetical protein
LISTLGIIPIPNLEAADTASLIFVVSNYSMNMLKYDTSYPRNYNRTILEVEIRYAITGNISLLEEKLHLNWLSLDYTLSELLKTEQTDG